MIKYFCDKCGKKLELGKGKVYTVSLDFEKPTNFIRNSHKRMNILLCEDCNELIVEKLENIIKDIKEDR